MPRGKGRVVLPGTERYNVKLTPAEHALAKEIGSGVISTGLSIALRFYSHRVCIEDDNLYALKLSGVEYELLKELGKGDPQIGLSFLLRNFIKQQATVAAMATA